jgi:hypothetical protein
MSDDNEMPESPVTDLAVGAAQLHEMYMAYMEAGFPEERAFELVTLTLDHFLGN